MAMQDIQTVFNTEEPENEAYAAALNEYAENLWKENKLHHKLWRMAKAANIAGDSYLYFADEKIIQLIKNTDMHLSNENDKDISAEDNMNAEKSQFPVSLPAANEKRGSYGFPPFPAFFLK